MARFCGICIWILSLPHQLIGIEKYIKKRCQSQNFLDPLLRERERERERAYGARETVLHNFDLLCCKSTLLLCDEE